MIYIILLVYLGFTFFGSLLGAKIKAATPESYFLANRNLKTIALFFTIIATNFSAFYFLGFAGEGYRIGYAHYVIMALGTALAGVTIILIGTRVWQLGKDHGYITPSELVYGQTGSRSLAMLFSGVMIVFTLPYLALQIVGGGYILEKMTDGDISYSLAVILLTVFTIIYVIIGGMTSVAKTDLKQGLIVIIFMVLGVVLIGHDLGGITAANITAAELVPELFSHNGANDFYTPQKWFSWIVFWMMAIPMFPQLFMRFYIAQDVKNLRQSAILYAIAPMFISILPVMIGIWGHISFPELTGSEIDQIMPLMLKKHTTEFFATIIMTGAIAAFMSTLDSQLLALSTMFTRDFYIPLRKKVINFKKEVLIGRVLVGVLAIIGMLIAFNPFDTIFAMGKMSFSGVAILFPIGLAVTRFKLTKPIFGIVAVVTALILLFAFHYGWISKQWTFGFEPFIILIGISFIITFMGVKKKKVQSTPPQH
ncbi:MAG: sodium:solute symporter family protein [Saprospiraceae bacterium]